MTQSQNTQQKPPKTEVLRGRKILFEIVRSETYDYRLRNWEHLILLDSWNVVLQTRYKRRTSHYSSEHLETILIFRGAPSFYFIAKKSRATTPYGYVTLSKDGRTAFNHGTIIFLRR